MPVSSAGEGEYWRSGAGRSHHGGDEPIAPTGHGRDVAVALLAVAQRASQGGDLHLEIAFLDEDVGPDPGHQLALADQVAGPLDQRHQNVERPAAETKRPVPLQEETLVWENVEGAERHRWRGQGDAPLTGRGLARK